MGFLSLLGRAQDRLAGRTAAPRWNVEVRGATHTKVQVTQGTFGKVQGKLAKSTCKKVAPAVSPTPSSTTATSTKASSADSPPAARPSDDHARVADALRPAVARTANRAHQASSSNQSIARVLPGFASAATPLQRSMGVALDLCAIWDIDLHSIEPAFEKGIFNILVLSLRLLGNIDLPDGDLTWILACAAQYGRTLSFGRRAAQAQERGPTERHRFCVEVAMVLMLAQTHLCDNPCFAPTWRRHVVKPLRAFFCSEAFGLQRHQLGDQPLVDQVIFGLFKDLGFHLSLKSPELALVFQGVTTEGV